MTFEKKIPQLNQNRLIRVGILLYNLLILGCVRLNFFLRGNRFSLISRFEILKPTPAHTSRTIWAKIYNRSRDIGFDCLRLIWLLFNFLFLVFENLAYKHLFTSKFLIVVSSFLQRFKTKPKKIVFKNLFIFLEFS